MGVGVDGLIGLDQKQFRRSNQLKQISVYNQIRAQHGDFIHMSILT